MDLLSNLSKCVDNFSRDSGILLSSLKQSEFEMTTNIINNFADYAEVWYPLFLDLLFDLVSQHSLDTRDDDLSNTSAETQRTRSSSADRRVRQAVPTFSFSRLGHA